MNPRHIETLPAWAALAALALIGWLLWQELRPPPRQSPADPVASLTESQGDVRVRDPESLAWGRARSGSALRAGDAVFAADGSSAMIAFNGGERLALGPRSLVVLAAPAEGAGVTLRQGVAAVLGGGGSLRVRVAGVSVVTPAGSRAAIACGPNGAVELFVEHGTAEVMAGAGAPGVAVETGQGLRVVGSAVAPLADGATLEAPSGGELILGNPDPIEPMPVEVRWAPAAPGDVVQVSTSPDFAAAAVTPPDAPGRARLLLRPGAHMLRMAGLDGEPRSTARLVVVASRSAPSPWQPMQGARVPAGRPVPLFWSEVAGATGYRLEVAPAEGAGASGLESAHPPAVLGAGRPGRWRWRAAARFPEGDGPWSGWVDYEVVDDFAVAPELQAPDLRVLPSERQEAK